MYAFFGALCMDWADILNYVTVSAQMRNFQCPYLRNYSQCHKVSKYQIACLLHENCMLVT